MERRPDKGHSFRPKSSKLTTLQISYINGVLQAPATIRQTFQNATGVSLLGDFSLALLRIVDDEVAVLKDVDKAASAEYKMLMTTSVLRLCSTACDNLHNEDDVAGALSSDKMCRVLKALTNDSEKSSHESSHVLKNQELIIFEAVRLLGSLGKAIPPSCKGSTLKVRWTFSTFRHTLYLMELNL